MQTFIVILLAFVCSGSSLCFAADVPVIRSQVSAAVVNNQSGYYWQSESISGTAQLLTLICRSCRVGETDRDVPLVSVLRDTLGDSDAANDRILYVWLLSDGHLNLGRRLLSAVPFFYWRVGDGSRSAQNTAPLLDLTAPEHPVLSGVTRDLLQWTLFDPMITPVRATTRAYRTNGGDYERLQLEEAAGYLRLAPTAEDGSALTPAELDTVIARLELRKKLLGGLVPDRNAALIGEKAGFEQERVRSRNWEVLRQCAERAGLLFQSLDVAGDSGQYGMLWFRSDGAPPTPGVSLAGVWKLLNIANPWTDPRVRSAQPATYMGAIDGNGSMVLADTPGAQRVQLVPLAFYSFNYPKFPLLLVDFRDKLHVRRHEMTQRAINDVTSGVIGISHFTNWYYYVAADLYDFFVSRHGAAMDRAARLDAYSQFRVALALDNSLDRDLRSDIERRMRSLDLNPLESRPEREIQLAVSRYQVLQVQAGPGGKLEARIEKDRRSELADFGESAKTRVFQTLVRDATFGLYTHRVSAQETSLIELDRDRRIQYQLTFLDSLVRAGTRPEVAYSASRVQASVHELSALMREVDAPLVRAHAAAVLEQLGKISRDPKLQNDCSLAFAELSRPVEPVRTPSAAGVVASAAAAAK